MSKSASLLVILMLAVATTGCGGGGGVSDAGVSDAGVSDAGACQGHQGCTQMGCPAVTGMSGTSNVVGFAVPIAAPLSDLPGSDVTSCRNGACVTGTVTLGDPGYYPVVFPANDTGTEATVRGTGPVLEVGWGRNTNLGPWSPWPEPQDGDSYSVEMKTSASVVVAAASGTATYQLSRPNGPCCDPICLKATVTMTPDAGSDASADGPADAATD
jgi:hypothetical protein